MPPSEEEERRGDDRSAVKVRVEYTRLNSFFADYTRNISKGGTFIRTTEPLDVGTEFVFVLSLPDATGAATTVLELTGEVKWVVTAADATEERPAGMGIQFVFADDEARAKVEGFVENLMHRSLGSHLAKKLLTT
jgi:type IV pilus assembly protein PilZ